MAVEASPLQTIPQWFGFRRRDDGQTVVSLLVGSTAERELGIEPSLDREPISAGSAWLETRINRFLRGCEDLLDLHPRAVREVRLLIEEAERRFPGDVTVPAWARLAVACDDADFDRDDLCEYLRGLRWQMRAGDGARKKLRTLRRLQRQGATNHASELHRRAPDLFQLPAGSPGKRARKVDHARDLMHELHREFLRPAVQCELGLKGEESVCGPSEAILLKWATFVFERTQRVNRGEGASPPFRGTREDFIKVFLDATTDPADDAATLVVGLAQAFDRKPGAQKDGVIVQYLNEPRCRKALRRKLWER